MPGFHTRMAVGLYATLSRNFLRRQESTTKRANNQTQAEMLLLLCSTSLLLLLNPHYLNLWCFLTSPWVGSERRWQLCKSCPRSLFPLTSISLFSPGSLLAIPSQMFLILLWYRYSSTATIFREKTLIVRFSEEEFERLKKYLIDTNNDFRGNWWLYQKIAKKAVLEGRGLNPMNFGQKYWA